MRGYLGPEVSLRSRSRLGVLRFPSAAALAVALAFAVALPVCSDLLLHRACAPPCAVTTSSDILTGAPLTSGRRRRSPSSASLELPMA